MNPTIATVILTIVAAPAAAGDWNWSVTPYVWTTAARVDVESDDQEVLESTAGFLWATGDEKPVRSHGPAHVEGAQHGEAPEHAEEAEQEHRGRPHHRNEIALFLGATDESGHDTELTLGLEYARTVAERWAIGGLIDYAGGELRNLVVGVPIFWHPGRGWKMFAAPGVELHRGRDGESLHSAQSGEQGEADEDETHFLVRLGAAYAFHLGERYGIEPWSASTSSTARRCGWSGST